MSEPYDTYIAAALSWAEARLGSRDYELVDVFPVEEVFHSEAVYIQAH